MPKSGFTKIKSSDTPLYGPRGLLLCGFSADAQSKFESLLAMLGLSSVPLVWASEDTSQQTVGELFGHDDGFGTGRSSQLPGAIVVAGIKEKQLHRLMSGCRKAGMKDTLWATLTPTSENWPLGALLEELQNERKAISSRKKR